MPLLEAQFRAQLELPLQNTLQEEAIDEEERILGHIKTTYQLNNEQIKKIQGYIVANGLQYVLDKIALTESQPRENTARFFLAALRDDYKMPVRHIPAKKIKAQKEVLPELTITEEEQRMNLEHIREWKRKRALGNEINYGSPSEKPLGPRIGTHAV